MLLRSAVSTPRKGQAVGNSFGTKSASGSSPQPAEKCPASGWERGPGAARKAAAGNGSDGMAWRRHGTGEDGTGRHGMGWHGTARALPPPHTLHGATHRSGAGQGTHTPEASVLIFKTKADPSPTKRKPRTTTKKIEKLYPVQNYPVFNKVYCPILALERSQYNCNISLSNKMSTSTK